MPARHHHRLSALEAAALLRRRELSAEALAQDCLARIAERETQVRAWAHIDADHVLRQARALDAGPLRGPLHGLPIGIKDVIDTAELPTQYGSPIYAGHQPAWDAACVTAIRRAGGVIMGKTVTSELATSYRGKTANPHNPAHTPGGSSSGSAAAVADFMVPLALGTQTGGSTLRPSSFCGVVGYKPSFGLLNRHGVKQVSESLDTLGLIGRAVTDVALLAGAVSGRSELLHCALREPPTIGIWRTFEWREAAPETHAALETAARVLSAAGAAVTERVMDPVFAELAAAHKDIQFREMAEALGYELRAHPEQLSASLRESIGYGMQVTPQVYDAKRVIAARARRLIDGVLSEYDMLLAPSAPGEAPHGLEDTGSPVFNRGWTLLRLPCVSVPAFTGPRGLPVGIQVVGRYWHDAKTLACAEWVYRQLESCRQR
ncbi:MAG: amidase [Burkholderiales bacterium]|nr:amidase [Burkholderiales bacterium]